MKLDSIDTTMPAVSSHLCDGPGLLAIIWADEKSRPSLRALINWRDGYFTFRPRSAGRCGKNAPYGRSRRHEAPMGTSPPRKKAGSRALSKLGTRGSDKNQPSIADPWVHARLNFLSAECSRLKAGPVARRFLKEARARYRQCRGCGCPRLRFLPWSACECSVVADQLIGRGGEQLPSEEDQP